MYHSIPSGTPKTSLFRALNPQTAIEMFGAKYEAGNLEVPFINKIFCFDSESHTWNPISFKRSAPDHAQTNL